MEVNIKQLDGNWDLGYSLDKHTIRSVPNGVNQGGYQAWDTTRSEAGEALFQLKYRSDYTKVPLIASQMHLSLSTYFSSAKIIVPMPPSKARQRQPVVEIARTLAQKMDIPCIENILVRNENTSQMKDIADKDEKKEALAETFTVNDQLVNGQYDILIIDDLFATGATFEVATQALREYRKIAKIYVATVTRKR